MDINKFEERIKNAFGQHRPEADTDAIWKNIEPRLKKKKKRRFIIWFWLFGLGLLLLFFGRDRWQHTTLATSNDSTISPVGKVAQGRGEDASVREKTITVSPKQLTKSEAENAVAEKEKTTLLASPSYKNTAKKSIQKAQEVAPKTGPSKLIDVLSNKTAADINIKSIEKAPEIPSIESALTHIDLSQNNLVPLSALPPTILDWITLVRDSVPYPSILYGMRPPKDSTKVERSKKEEKVDKIAQEDKKKPTQRKKSKRQKSHWEYSMGLQAGPALAIKQLRERSDVIAPLGHLKKRQTTEHTMESYTAGMFYSAAYRGLVLKTGLNYRQSNEKFHLAYNKEETEQINGILSIVLDGAGNTVEQTRGNKTVIKTTEYSNTAYNHYRFINLPVGLGYRHANQRSRWELSGGMDVNLLFRANGIIYNKYNVPAKFKDGNSTYEDMFRENTGLGLWAGYAYDWRMTDKLRWQLSANVQVPLRPVSNPDYALVQRYFNVGLQVGIVYQIKKATKGK